ADRSNERLGRSDAAIILWRKILERELRAIDQPEAETVEAGPRRRAADAGVLVYFVSTQLSLRAKRSNLPPSWVTRWGLLRRSAPRNDNQNSEKPSRPSPAVRERVG